jgi:hypothetical protein
VPNHYSWSSQGKRLQKASKQSWKRAQSVYRVTINDSSDFKPLYFQKYYTYNKNWYMKRTGNSPSFSCDTPGGSSAVTKWRRRKRVFVCWNMRGVHLLLQCSVHSDENIIKKRQVSRAFCGGIVSLRTLVVCVNGKARGDQAWLMKRWREWGRVSCAVHRNRQPTKCMERTWLPLRCVPCDQRGTHRTFVV